jgi:ribonucleoside-triphosphate reductase
MKQVKIPTEIYSRVVGYFRPTSQWNRGKMEEYSERINLVVKK